MGSGKSTLALQVHHNLTGNGMSGLLCARLGRDDGRVTSRLGPSAHSVEVGADLDLLALAKRHEAEHGRLDYLVCDEAQFFTRAQVDQLASVVDDIGADVYAYGLITDFRGVLFEGTQRLLEIADERVPLHVEARCWCGARATNNARVVNGDMVTEGDTVVVGDTATPDEPLFGDVVSYELLCRRHYREGRIAPRV